MKLFLDTAHLADLETATDTATGEDAATPSIQSDVQLGSILGPYKLLQRLGEGGFGEVFLAEQDEPVRRQVALKIIKPGMDSREVMARFEAERQALAIMDHPNIAQVFDDGIHFLIPRQRCVPEVMRVQAVCIRFNDLFGQIHHRARRTKIALDIAPVPRQPLLLLLA